MKVRAPDGRSWVVRRRPGRRPQWREIDPPLEAMIGGPDIGGGDDLAGIVAGILLSILVSILLALVIAILLPAVLFGGEAILIALGLVVAAGPWRVEAVTAGPPAEARRWRVRGVLRSRRAVREVADELRRDVEAEPEDAER